MFNFREKWEINLTIWHTVLSSIHGCLQFQRHQKYLSDAIIRFCDRLLKLRWYGFYLLNKKPWSHHSYNVNTSKNYVNNISRVTVKIFSDSVKNRHFSRLHNGSKNMFENTGDESYFSVFFNIVSNMFLWAQYFK